MKPERSLFTQDFSSQTTLSNGLLVVFGAHGGAGLMLDLVARLSLRGPVYLLDCGNRSDMYRVARTLRSLTDDPVAILRNIRLSRAFTCYQVVALLEKISSGVPAPVLVLDLLSTFMDESVQVNESSMLFNRALHSLTAAASSAPVIVSAKPLLSLSTPRFGLLEQLKSEAAEVWEENVLPPTRLDEIQLPLFSGD
ncbi:MAG: hypothetical protein ABFC97_06760 [Anaerolineaceae bacterium]